MSRFRVLLDPHSTQRCFPIDGSKVNLCPRYSNNCETSLMLCCLLRRIFYTIASSWSLCMHWIYVHESFIHRSPHWRRNMVGTWVHVPSTKIPSGYSNVTVPTRFFCQKQVFHAHFIKINYYSLHETKVPWSAFFQWPSHESSVITVVTKPALGNRNSKLGWLRVA